MWVCELHACIHVWEAGALARLKGARKNPKEAPAHSLENLWQLGRRGSVAWCQGQDSLPEPVITGIPTHNISCCCVFPQSPQPVPSAFKRYLTTVQPTCTQLYCFSVSKQNSIWKGFNHGNMFFEKWKTIHKDLESHYFVVFPMSWACCTLHA